MEPGYYRIRSKRTDAAWLVARYDGGNELQWTFIGSLHFMDTEELLNGSEESDMIYEIGPRIDPPT